MREAGVSLTGIALAGALSLPWLLKALWAPLVDRYTSPRFGRRKSWIIPAQLGLLLCIIAAAFIPRGENLTLLAALILAMNTCAATQDIAVDGLAVDLLKPEELGPGNAAQVIGFKMGMVTSGGLLVWASGALGWSGLFAVMALLIALVLLVAFALTNLR